MEHLLSPATLATTERQLMRAFMHMHRAEWHERNIGGCTSSEVRVLMCIRHGSNAESPDIKVTQISKLLHVTSPAVTQLLKGLEAKGLVERHEDATDKRAVNFRLTTQGDVIVSAAIAMFLTSIRGLIDFLGEEQSAQLAELLTKTFYYFSERAALANDTPWNGDAD